MKQRTRLMNNGDELTGYSMTKKHDGEEEIQLHKVRPQGNFIEAQIQEGDTLQAIALRFYCTISELKRINHIHKDNEIFARRTIKVPVTPYSVLTTHLVEPVPSTSNHIPLIVNTTDQAPTEKKDFSIDCNAAVLNSTIAPSVIPYTDEPNENVAEDTMLLPQKERVPVETVVVKELTSHGADFGLKWFHLLCVIIVLGVLVPVIYVLTHVHLPEHEDLAPLHKP